MVSTVRAARRFERRAGNLTFGQFLRHAASRDDAAETAEGFVNDEGNAHGRPVGVAIDKKGALLVADDVGNAIWRVTGNEASRPEIHTSEASPNNETR